MASVIRTEHAPLLSDPPPVDSARYPAELHIGVRHDWRRRGVGADLMRAFETYLQRRGVAGYRIYASSYHQQGVSFYRRMGLTELGEFGRRFHDGYCWLDVSEHVFVRDLTSRLRPPSHESERTVT
jgi:GNAT superfamily N-acetyltransferase